MTPAGFSPPFFASVREWSLKRRKNNIKISCLFFFSSISTSDVTDDLEFPERILRQGKEREAEGRRREGEEERGKERWRG